MIANKKNVIDLEINKQKRNGELSRLCHFEVTEQVHYHSKLNISLW